MNSGDKTIDQQMDERYGRRSGRYDMRVRKEASYGYRYGFDNSEGAAMVTLKQQSDTSQSGTCQPHR